MRPAEIFDVDGTLCDVRSARHHVLNKPKNFDAFHSDALACPPHQHVVDGANRAHNQGHAVIVVTARKERWRNQTGFWLAMHGIPSDHLYMRDDFDQRKDVDVKRDILARIRKRFEVVRAWDDNPSIVALWESEGIEVELVDGWVA